MKAALRNIWYSLAFRIILFGGLALLCVGLVWYFWGRFGAGALLAPVLGGGAILSTGLHKLGAARVERGKDGRPIRADMGSRGDEVKEVKQPDGTVVRYKRKRPRRGGGRGAF
jgi:hypothetical protein